MQPSPIDAELARVLRVGRLRHVFQPIWDLRERRLVGFEALARFSRGLPPQQVWEVARGTGVGLELDGISVQSALMESASLPGRLFVNVCAGYLGTRKTPNETIRSLILRHRREGRDVVLEVTEDEVNDVALAAAWVRAAHRSGIAIALDDGGAGEATLARIRLLHPALEFVKLDRALVGSWLQYRDRRLHRWIHQAREYNAQVIAEGVEWPEAASLLASAGVRFIQGYAFGRPDRPAAWTPRRVEELSPVCCSVADA